MSIIIDNGPFKHEITEDGELIFLDYDIEYDQAALEFGYSETPALVELRAWDRDPCCTLIEFVGETLSRTEVALIGGKWLDMVRERLGVEKILDMPVAGIIEKIYVAIAERNLENRDGIEAIAEGMGRVGATYQQQLWMQPSLGSTGVQNSLDMALALNNYLSLIRHTMQSLPFWERHGVLQPDGRWRAIRYLRNIPSDAIHNMAFVDLSKRIKGPFEPHQIVEAKSRIGKAFAGAAVAILAEQRG